MDTKPYIHLDPEWLKKAVENSRLMRAGLRKPGGVTKYLKRKGKRIRKSWRSFDGMIVEQEISEDGSKKTEVAKYPGICYFSKKSKMWEIRKK